MYKLFRFFLLPYQKKKLLIQSLFLVCAIRLCLWLFPFKWLSKWFSYFDSDNPNKKEIDWEIINNVVASVRIISKYIPYSSCLTQALATRTLLNLKGQDSNLRIGVDKENTEDFAAHAWIEIDEKIIIGKLPYHHRRFSTLNPSDSVVI
jgi:hypothetical protein